MTCFCDDSILEHDDHVETVKPKLRTLTSSGYHVMFMIDDQGRAIYSLPAPLRDLGDPLLVAADMRVVLAEEWNLHYQQTAQGLDAAKEVAEAVEDPGPSVSIPRPVTSRSWSATVKQRYSSSFRERSWSLRNPLLFIPASFAASVLFPPVFDSIEST